MSLTMIGKKRGMTRLFDQKSGQVVPCTVIELEPNVITQVKTQEKDGYRAIQLGAISMKSSEKKKQKKPQAGAFAVREIEPRKVLLESRNGTVEGAEVGKEICVDYFKEGTFVDVRGRSKGKGYQGVIKRHNVSRLVESHGAGPVVRHMGSVGSLTSHGRVHKNKKDSGHMGDERVLVENLEVVRIDTNLNALVVKGAIPGANGGVVMIRNSIKKRHSK